MDPARSSSPLDRLERIEGVLGQHAEMITAAVSDAQREAESNRHTLAALASQLQQITALLTQPAASTSPPAPVSVPVPAPLLPADAPEPRVGTPERYDGDPETCGPFITNCSLLFSLQPRTFASEQAKVAFTINHLTGRARLWGTAEWERRSPSCTSFQSFADELRKVFGLGASRSEMAQGLMGMRQGDRRVADYSIDFRTRASMSSWNPAALVDAFHHGLAEYIKDELVSHEVPTTLDGIIELAIRIDLRIQARRRERRQESARRQLPCRPGGGANVSTLSPVQPLEEPEPMQLGRTSLTLEERERRRRSRLCMYCGGAGHFVSSCPAKASAHP